MTWLPLVAVLFAPPQDVRVLVLPEARLEELLTELELEAAPDQAPASLAVPTALYLAAIGSEWTTASTACALACSAWTRTLPTVENAKVAIPLGLGINAAVLVLVHKVIAPRWPRVAEGLLVGLSTFHGASAVQHAAHSRRILKGTP